MLALSMPYGAFRESVLIIDLSKKEKEEKHRRKFSEFRLIKLL